MAIYPTYPLPISNLGQKEEILEKRMLKNTNAWFSMVQSKTRVRKN
jgi:hypothetical protein